MLIIINNNVANSIDLIQQALHVTLIGFDKIFEHLLRPKRYLKVMTVLLIVLGQIAVRHFLAKPNIGVERIVGLPQYIQSVACRRSVKLRVMTGNKIFRTTKVNGA